MYEKIQDEEQRKRKQYFTELYREFNNVLQIKSFEHGAPEGLDKAIMGVVFGINDYEYFNGNIPLETYTEEDPAALFLIKRIQGYQNEEQVMDARSTKIEAILGGLEYGTNSKEEINEYKLKLDKSGLVDPRFGYSAKELMIVAGLKREYKELIKESIQNQIRKSDSKFINSIEEKLKEKNPESYDDAKRQDYIEKRKEIVSEIDFMKLKACKLFFENYEMAFKIAKETFEEIYQNNKEQIDKYFEKVKGDKK